MLQSVKTIVVTHLVFSVIFVYLPQYSCFWSINESIFFPCWPTSALFNNWNSRHSIANNNLTLAIFWYKRWIIIRLIICILVEIFVFMCLHIWHLSRSQIIRPQNNQKICLGLICLQIYKDKFGMLARFANICRILNMPYTVFSSFPCRVGALKVFFFALFYRSVFLILIQGCYLLLKTIQQPGTNFLNNSILAKVL